VHAEEPHDADTQTTRDGTMLTAHDSNDKHGPEIGRCNETTTEVCCSGFHTFMVCD
jgi:hypothetical protein